MDELRVRVLRAVRTATEPLDDDELALRLQVQPRQSINQICRRLEAEGHLRRTTGPRGKIVNTLAVLGDKPSEPCRCGCGKHPVRKGARYLSGHDARHASAVAGKIARDNLDTAEQELLLDSLGTTALREKALAIATRRALAPSMPREPAPAVTDLDLEAGAVDEAPPGNSSAQREAESCMLDILGHQLGMQLTVGHITTPAGARVEIDGADLDRTVLVEAWAHQGPPKSAQKHKVLADALKLLWISKSLPRRPRLILLMSDVEAARPFTYGRSWAAEALRNLGIEVVVVDLPKEVREHVRQAQNRQYR